VELHDRHLPESVSLLWQSEELKIIFTTLIELPPTMAVSKAVNLLKSNSSRWMTQRGTQFAWQEGFGASAITATAN